MGFIMITNGRHRRPASHSAARTDGTSSQAPSGPHWGKLKAKVIRKRDVVVLLDKILERGATTQANRTFACVRKEFNWAAQKDLVEGSPCAGIKAPSKERTKDRVLTDDEICAFWNLSGLSPRMKAALRGCNSC